MERSRRCMLGALAALILLAGCDMFDLYTLLDGKPPDDDPAPEPTELRLGVGEISLYGGGMYAFSATGGVPPYRYTVESGEGTIGEITGLYTAPGQAESGTIRVTDYVGATDEAEVTVLDPVRFLIAPSEVTLAPGATVTFVATGGVAPVLYELISGPGVVDADTGVYTAPVAPGTGEIRATDARGSVAEAVITIASGLEFTISPVTVTLYVNNTIEFGAFGGIPPYDYEIAAGTGSVDAGSGLYQAPSTPDTDQVRVVDSDGNASTATVTVLAPFLLTPSNLQVSVGSSYGFIASGGVAPYTYQIVSGTGSVDGAGWYTAPAAPSSDLVRAEDALGNTATATVVVTAAAPLVITPAGITLNVTASTLFMASGGRAPYTYSVQSGAGTVSAVSGLYTAPGAPESGVVRVTDDLGATSEATVVVVNGGPLAIAPAIVTVEQGQGVGFSGSGGSPGYVYGVTAGLGSVNAATGWYTAPLSLGVATVRVTDTLAAWVEAAVSIAPRSPASLIADGEAGGPQDIRLTWLDRSTGEDGFRVERRTGIDPYAEIATVGADVTTYDDTGLVPNTVYIYRVRAWYASVDSPYSEEGFAVSNP